MNLTNAPNSPVSISPLLLLLLLLPLGRAAAARLGVLLMGTRAPRPLGKAAAAIRQRIEELPRCCGCKSAPPSLDRVRPGVVGSPVPATPPARKLSSGPVRPRGLRRSLCVCEPCCRPPGKTPTAKAASLRYRLRRAPRRAGFPAFRRLLPAPLPARCPRVRPVGWRVRRKRRRPPTPRPRSRSLASPRGASLFLRLSSRLP